MAKRTKRGIPQQPQKSGENTALFVLFFGFSCPSSGS
jgi:hypothetical protein